MFKMKKEVKIGIYAVVIILAAWAGIRFLSGADVLGRNATYYAYYDEAAGLQSASAVMIRGVKVGQVTQVVVAPENPTQVKVTMSVSRDYKLPSDSKAKIFSAGLMGGKAVEIILGSSSELLENGADIQQEVEQDMLEMATSELGDLKAKVVALIDNLNTTVTGLNSIVDNNNANITSAVANLNAVLADLKRSNIVANIDSFTGALSQNGERIDSVMMGVNAIVAELQQRELAKSLSEAVATLNDVLAKVNTSEGTVGGLLGDRALYDNLATASNNLSTLLADLKENPGRYVHFSLFGVDEEKKAAKAAKKAAKAEKKSVKRAE